MVIGAILLIEDDNDFDQYYHTVNDLIQYINQPYFFKMAKLSFATLASFALNLNMNIFHTPVASTTQTTPIITTALISTGLDIGSGMRKQSGANTVQVAERVKAALAGIQGQLRAGSRVAMVVGGARFIRSSISAVQEDMILGGALAVLVVLLFLRNLRSTLVSALALPTSIIGTFAAMRALDFTFNVVTMLALTLSIGLLIDDAIVVIENIVRHLEHGESPKVAAEKGTSEIALAVLAVTLAVVAVFVPVAFMKGLIGRLFYQFGVTVAGAVLISYWTVSGASVWPMKIEAATFRLSAPLAPISRVISLATALTITCITPRW